MCYYKQLLQLFLVRFSVLRASFSFFSTRLDCIKNKIILCLCHRKTASKDYLNMSSVGNNKWIDTRYQWWYISYSRADLLVPASYRWRDRSARRRSVLKYLSHNIPVVVFIYIVVQVCGWCLGWKTVVSKLPCNWSLRQFRTSWLIAKICYVIACQGL